MSKGKTGVYVCPLGDVIQPVLCLQTLAGLSQRMPGTLQVGF